MLWKMPWFQRSSREPYTEVRDCVSWETGQHHTTQRVQKKSYFAWTYSRCFVPGNSKRTSSHHGTQHHQVCPTGLQQASPRACGNLESQPPPQAFWVSVWILTRSSVSLRSASLSSTSMVQNRWLKTMNRRERKEGRGSQGDGEKERRRSRRERKEQWREGEEGEEERQERRRGGNGERTTIIDTWWALTVAGAFWPLTSR